MKKNFLLLLLLFLAFKDFAQCPVVDAGQNKIYCKGLYDTLSINGTVSNYDSLRWFTNGHGSFWNTNFPSTGYHPDTTESNSPFFVVFVTAYKGNCSVTDSFLVSVENGPNLTVMNDTAIGISQGYIDLHASASPGSAIHWSNSGYGNLTSPDSAYTRYNLGVNDSLYSYMYFYVSATAANGCTAYDNVAVKFNRPAAACTNYVDAGPDKILCSSENVVNLQAYSNLYYITWTSSGTGNFDFNGNWTTNYTPSLQDKANGFVSFIATVNDGFCQASDTIDVYFTPGHSALITASADSICPGQLVTLTATATGGNGPYTFSWNSDSAIVGTSTQLVLNPYYGGNYTVEVKGANGCVSHATHFITINAPSVYAGNDIAVQTGQNSVALSGWANGYTDVYWTTAGSGFFSNAKTLNGNYTFSENDKIAGGVKLTLHASNQTCSISDELTVFISDSLSVCDFDVNFSVTNNSVSFSVENSNATGLGWYSWNFGDNSYGYGPNVFHTFAHPGFHAVFVTYYSYLGYCSYTDSIPFSITTFADSLAPLAGQVKAGGTLADHVTVVLFKLENNNYIFHSLAEAPNGDYDLGHVAYGQYLMIAYPTVESSQYYSYYPTYTGDAISWYNGASFVVNGSSTGPVINLVSYFPVNTTWNQGSDTLSGFITYDQSQLRVASSASTPVFNAVVTLYDANDNRLGSVVTDEFGYFEFPGLVAGNYYYVVDYAGTSIVASDVIVVDGDAETNESAGSSLTRVSTKTTKPVQSTNIKVYPNPAPTFVNIELPSNIQAETITLINSLGEEVEQFSTASNRVTLNTEKLNSGVYVIRISSNNGEEFVTRFIK